MLIHTFFRSQVGSGSRSHDLFGDFEFIPLIRTSEAGFQKWSYSWWLLYSSRQNWLNYTPGVQHRYTVEDFHFNYFPSSSFLIWKAYFYLFNIPLPLWNKNTPSLRIIVNNCFTGFPGPLCFPPKLHSRSNLTRVPMRFGPEHNNS